MQKIYLPGERPKLTNKEFSWCKRNTCSSARDMGRFKQPECDFINISDKAKPYWPIPKGCPRGYARTQKNGADIVDGEFRDL